MIHKGKVAVFFGTAVLVLYGVSATFYGKVVAKDEAYRELTVFMDALRKINEDYVEAPDMSKVQIGAMRGLLDALDPYSSFLSKSDFEAMQKRKNTGAAGVGMIISKRADVVHVVATTNDGPADRAGIHAGDYLVAVDGTSVDDKSVLEAVSLLRGAAGSGVKLTIFRNARAKPLDVELVRSADTAPKVTSQMLDGAIGYLDVGSLNESTSEQAKVKLKTLISAGARKLILDLRDCADGTVTEGAELANFFLNNGMIFYAQNRQGEKVQEVQASPEKFIADLPMAVLINSSTAGPAEIVAGALKDRKRAVLVGEKSFGIGSAQKQIALKSGAVLILSTAKYYTPNGKLIQDDSARDTGIKPDVQTPDDESRQDLAVESYYDDQDDAARYKQFQEKVRKIQLEKALELLSKEAEKRAA
jgi:carboxyl-terminal processing protease